MSNQTVKWPRNPSTGLLDPNYYPETSSSWRILAEYRLDKTQEMMVNYPIPDAGTYAAHEWADTKEEYSVRMVWRGGEAPFKIDVIEQPSWAKLGAGVISQVFDRVDSGVAGLLKHNMPYNYAKVTGFPSAGHVGDTFDFSYRITSQDNQQVVISWSCTVDDSGRIKYVDAVNGLDSNDGSLEAPFQTFHKVWNLADASQYVFRFKDGTYAVSDGAGGNANFGTGKPISLIGSGTDSASVIFDMSNGTLGGSAGDITITNLTIAGAPADSANPRQVGLNGSAPRIHISGVRWDTRIGTDNGDNPCGLFIPDGGDPSMNVSIVDCVLLPTSQSSMVIYFNVDNFVEENNSAAGVVFPITNGSLVSHIKGRARNGSVRLCDYSADSPNGLIWVSNQGYVDCRNVELQFCRLENVGSGNSEPYRSNGQVHSPPMTRPAGMLVQRCSIAAGDVGPFNFEAYQPGDDVEYGGILWSSSTASAIDSTGSVSLASTSLKVADIDIINESSAGKGWVIVSPLVS